VSLVFFFINKQQTFSSRAYKSATSQVFRNFISNVGNDGLTGEDKRIIADMFYNIFLVKSRQKTPELIDERKYVNNDESDDEYEYNSDESSDSIIMLN